jgi:aspartate aminotransferase
MSTTITKTAGSELNLSKMAENLIGSEILKLSGEINERIRNGEKIANYTVGDFNPAIFPLPDEFRKEIIAAYNDNHSNYPPSDGILALRQSVARFLQQRLGLDYSPQSEILIAGGARPIIYAAYRAIIDPGDHVFYPAPSWNNNHYIHLTGAKPVMMEAKAENNFMPTADDLLPHIGKLQLISLCSPQNPTGTIFTKEGLEAICQIILQENKRRGGKKKPVYLLYDQVYNQLTYGDAKHYNPVTLCPEIRDYVIFVDGISKSLAATGVRIGWSMGNQKVMDKMKSIIGHVGAWAPKAEQVALANYLDNTAAVDSFMEEFKDKLSQRLRAFYNGFMELKKEGFRVNAIAPQAAIYLTVQFSLKGMKTPDGKTLAGTTDITRFLLQEAKLALVPFYAFGASPESSWYRLSVGTADLNGIPAVIALLRSALQQLKP